MSASGGFNYGYNTNARNGPTVQQPTFPGAGYIPKIRQQFANAPHPQDQTSQYGQSADWYQQMMDLYGNATQQQQGLFQNMLGSQNQYLQNLGTDQNADLYQRYLALINGTDPNTQALLDTYKINPADRLSRAYYAYGF
jgi:hypothetical protein